MDPLLSCPNGRRDLFPVLGPRRQAERSSQQRRLVGKALAGELQRHLIGQRAQDGFPQSDGVDLGGRRIIKKKKLLLDDGEGVSPILKTQRRLSSRERQRICEVEKWIDGIRFRIP